MASVVTTTQHCIVIFRPCLLLKEVGVSQKCLHHVFFYHCVHGPHPRHQLIPKDIAGAGEGRSEPRCSGCRMDILSATRYSLPSSFKKRCLWQGSSHGWINDKVQISGSLIFLMDWLALCLLDCTMRKKIPLKITVQNYTCDGLLKALLYLISVGGPCKFEVLSLRCPALCVLIESNAHWPLHKLKAKQPHWL